MKFSIIIPVYNVEKYIEKCLNSIYEQLYNNYEIIIVNDGSPDDSEQIIKKTIKNKKNTHYYKKENGGLSDARNYGLQYVTGDYILFIDSDDYIEKDLLFKLNEILTIKKYDLIKFNFIDMINGEKIMHTEKLKESKETSLAELIKLDYFEPACSYCYNTNFFTKNKFKFTKNKYHEDFGLIPLIVLKAKNIYYLNYFGYVYLKRENSITSAETNQEKKAMDTLYFSIKNIEKILILKNISAKDKELMLNFYSVAAINKLKKVKNKKTYKKLLKQEKMHRFLSNQTIKEKIKKMICKFSYNLYIYLF